MKQEKINNLLDDAIPISNQILDLLLTKHTKDLCVPECKNGPTWGANHLLIMDLWVMPRSWAHFVTICYEIKTNRSDFLNDKKWVNYLNYCHEFYFVCPPGVVQPNELPPEAGLLVTSKNIKCLYNKKPAIKREIEIPIEMLAYILMCRTDIRKNVYHSPDLSNTEYWKNWLHRKRENKELGEICSKKIRELIKKRIYEVESKNNRLERDIEALKEAQELLKEYGLDKDYHWKWHLRERLEKIKQKANFSFDEFFSEIEKAVDQYQKVKSMLEMIRN